MKKKNIAFWIATALFCLVFTAGGTANLLRVDFQVESIQTLGYPLYLMTILGVAKLAGVVALLIPRFPTLKEWAYAGFAFDMLGASASHAFVSDPIAETILPLVILAIGAVSYCLRPASRRVVPAVTQALVAAADETVSRSTTPHKVASIGGIAIAALLFSFQNFSTPEPLKQNQPRDTKMVIETSELSATQAAVKKAIDDLIQTATTYNTHELDRIYHDDLEIIMLDVSGELNRANKEGFKALFDSKREAGDPPMNTWAQYHDIQSNEKAAHVLLSRKNNLSGEEKTLVLSIDLVFEDQRWQVTREVIFLRPSN